MLKVQKLQKKYESVTVLDDINLTVDKSEIATVIGPNGSGKTTLLRCLAGLEDPTDGKMILDGQEINFLDRDAPKVHSEIGIVFQQFNLFGHLTSVENVTLALMKVKKMTKLASRRLAMKTLRLVGLENKFDEYPRHLSSGEQQRVALVRSLVLEPKLLMLDEPTSALDLESIQAVIELIKYFANREMAILIATQDMEFAKTISDKVLFLDQKHIIEQGKPQQVMKHSKNARVKRFFAKK